jgi:SAM-dependent methyltransferase
VSARLNLGCGRDIRPGFVNLDVAPLPGVDVVHDLDSGPLPFEDAAFEEIVCKDVLEHVADLVAVMRELHRVSVPGARLEIESPHFSSRAFYVDPTHRRAFSVDTFDFFAGGGGFGERDYYFDFHFAGVESVRLVFHRQRYRPWNYAVEPLVNTSRGVQAFYEDTALARLFPASNVRFVLRR